MSFWGCGWLGYDLEIGWVYDLEIGWGFLHGIAVIPGLGVLVILKQYTN